MDVIYKLSLRLMVVICRGLIIKNKQGLFITKKNINNNNLIKYVFLNYFCRIIVYILVLLCVSYTKLKKNIYKCEHGGRRNKLLTHILINNSIQKHIMEIKCVIGKVCNFHSI